MRKIVMTARRVLALASILMVAVSCEKDHGGLYQGSDAEGGASGKQLIAINEIEYCKYFSDYVLRNTEGYYYGTNMIWQGGRLTEMIVKRIKNGAIVENGRATFSYQGENPTEVTITSSEGDETESATMYITYSDGRVSEVYMVEGDEWEKMNYAYSSDGKLESVTQTSMGGTMRNYVMTWTGNNITTVKRYDNGTLENTYTFTYDSKKRPTDAIPTWFQIIMSDGYSWASANNVILRTYETSYGYTRTYSYAYTYDGDYPVKCIETYRYEGSSGYSDVYTTTSYYEYADGTGNNLLPKIFEIGTASNNDQWGYVSGGGDYVEGSEVILYANSLYQHDFLQWSDGNTNNPRTVSATGNATYTAIFSN